MLSLSLKNERGNVLFLILIAVALFAALSYAVTRSGRSSGSVGREKVQVAIAEMFSSLIAIQTAYSRIRLAGGTPIFCQAGDADGECEVGATGTEALCTTGSNCVWAAQGGGVPLPTLPRDLREAPTEGLYTFLDSQATNNVMAGVGTTQGEVVVFIYGFSKTACDEINTKLGLSLPLPVEVDGFAGGGLNAYPGKPMKCWDAGINGYQFAYAVEER